MLWYKSRHRCKKAAQKVYAVNKAFLKNTTFQGYHYLADPGLHWTERLFWGICLIVVSGYGILLMWRSMNQYQKNPLSLTVDTLYLEWQSQVPAIIICDSNQEDYPGIERFIQDTISPSDRLDYISVARDYVYFIGDIIASKDCANATVKTPLCQFVAQNISRLTDLRLKCKDIFAECYWNDVKFDCCERFLPINTIYGPCYAINSIASNTPPSTLDTVNAFDASKHTFYLKTSEITAFILSPEENLSYRETSSTKIENLVSAMSILDVYIKFKNMVNDANVRSVPIEFRGCRYPDENNLKLSPVYSYPACVVDEFAKLQKKVCGCMQYYLPVYAKKADYCETVEQMMCISANLGKLAAHARMTGCLPSCTESHVQIVGIISTKGEENMDWNNDSGIIAKINIHYYSPRLSYQRKVMRDTIDLIVNVGGIGTLFFGASIISILEFFYYLILYPCTDHEDDEENVALRLKTPKTNSQDVLMYFKYKKGVLVAAANQRRRVIPFRN